MLSDNKIYIYIYVMPEYVIPDSTIPYSGIFLSGGPGGQRSNILYVTCGTIIRRVVAAARCKSSVIDFWIFF